MKLFYMLGLWMGDKYIWENSVGLTNTQKNLVNIFKTIVLSVFPDLTPKIKKINNGKAYRVYFNSSHLLSYLQALAKKIVKIIDTEEKFINYISGKIDADGTIMPYNLKWKTGLIKITYGNPKELLADYKLCKKFGYTACILPYKTRNAWDLKFTFRSSLQLLKKLKLHHPTKKRKTKFLIRLVERQSSYREACR